MSCHDEVCTCIKAKWRIIQSQSWEWSRGLISIWLISTNVILTHSEPRALYGKRITYTGIIHTSFPLNPSANSSRYISFSHIGSIKLLLQHRLLLLLLFLLPVHDTEDDLPLLLGEVAQVRHLRQDRPAAEPSWSRHLYTPMLKKINNQT